MTSSAKTWVIVVLSAIIGIGLVLTGFYSYPKVYPCPSFTSSHTVVYDTASKHIYHIYPWYVEKLVSITHNDPVWMDSVMKANKIDSAELADRYYSNYQYERTITDIDTATKDTSLVVKWLDVISQNQIMPNAGFDYKYIRPTYITENIDNSISYNKYIYVAGTIPLPDTKLSDIGLYYAYKRGLFGAGYMPLVKGGGIRITGGFTLFKIK